ncbi:MAG TPA: DUF1573 domain-containing protein [Saprospiraceae bacterium]|nr:DUF1573 domain-containing protein [Saprospiraceae bacterium]
MKKLASIVAILALSLTMVVAQTKNAKDVKAQTPAPKEQTVTGPGMVFEAETIDYGTIQQYADGERVFKFKNNGSEPLIIKNATGSCGCTVPTFTNKPIMPGETGEIKVKYATDRLGKFNKTVTVTSNATPDTKVLTIKGDVLKKEEPAGVPNGEKGIFNKN